GAWSVRWNATGSPSGGVRERTTPDQSEGKGNMTRRIGATLLGMIVAVATTACMQTDNSNMNATSNRSAGSESARTVSSTDREFMTKAAAGGIAEVEMGRLATQKGASEDVKKFGQRMIDDHSKANNELMSLAAKKGVSLPTTPDAKTQDEIDR